MTLKKFFQSRGVESCLRSLHEAQQKIIFPGR